MLEAKPITEQQRARLQSLAEDFPALWNHPEADPRLKKRIVRAAVEEVFVTHQPDQQQLEITIHWKGGAHTRAHVKKRATPRGSKATPELVGLVCQLSQEIGDAEIARILNMKKSKSPQGLES